MIYIKNDFYIRSIWNTPLSARVVDVDSEHFFKGDKMSKNNELEFTHHVKVADDVIWENIFTYRGWWSNEIGTSFKCRRDKKHRTVSFADMEGAGRFALLYGNGSVPIQTRRLPLDDIADIWEWLSNNVGRCEVDWLMKGNIVHGTLGNLDEIILTVPFRDQNKAMQFKLVWG